MRFPNINRDDKRRYKERLESLKNEYDTLIDLLLSQEGSPSKDQIERKNYLESELFIIESNKK